MNDDFVWGHWYWISSRLGKQLCFGALGLPAWFKVLELKQDVANNECDADATL